MQSILRSVGAVLLGALVAGVLIMAIEFLASVIYPLPPGVDPRDAEAVEAAMAGAPTGALLLVLLSWMAGSFAGAWTAARSAGRSPIAHGLVVGALLLAGGIYNMMTIPHPLWFWVVAVAVFLPSAYFGARLAAGSTGRNQSLAPA